MFATSALLVFLASSAGIARAVVVPSTPGPGTIYKVGEQCITTWNGNGDNTWRNMQIDLMSGDNWNMTKTAFVMTGLDGSQAGRYTHDCPDVTPYSAIYFYQFTNSAQAKAWTTRFTIASRTGETTPPSESKQPDGQLIPWGVGTLVNPASTNSPDCNCPTNSPNGTTPVTSNGSSSAPAPGFVNPPPSTPTTTLRFVTTISSSVPISTARNGSVSANSKDNGAMTMASDARVWQAAVALTASAIAFVALL